MWCYNSPLKEVYSYDLRVTPESIIEVRGAVSAELIQYDYRIDNIGLLIEESDGPDGDFLNPVFDQRFIKLRQVGGLLIKLM